MPCKFWTSFKKYVNYVRTLHVVINYALIVKSIKILYWPIGLQLSMETNINNNNRTTLFGMLHYSYKFNYKTNAVAWYS